MRHDGRREYAVRLQDISEALIADGYTSLDAQAKALGVHRSTAWTIMNAAVRHFANWYAGLRTAHIQLLGVRATAYCARRI